MRVEIISATPCPVDVISLAAGVCYGKRDVSEKRVSNCYKAGHMSVFEHASVTVKVEGVSRACMAQLTRHRLCSFCVESQRYNRYDLSGDDWCVIPPAFNESEDSRDNFNLVAGACAYEYMAALDMGIKPEDARYLLPEATKTNLVMTCNVRELFHIFAMRCDKAAQWEIRELAETMRDQVADISEQWRKVMELEKLITTVKVTE